jgi:hypothetical protein
MKKFKPLACGFHSHADMSLDGGSTAKDPGDLTSEEIRWGVENAQSALLGESAYVQRDAQTVSG